MNHPSEKINKQASFFKKVFERLVNKGAEIIKVDVDARVEIDKRGHREEGGAIVLSAKASNKKYDAVIEEAKNIRRHERTPWRLESDLRETAEDDHWRYFALRLILGDGYNKDSFHDDFPKRLISHDALPTRLQNMVLNHPSKEIGKQFAFYTRVVERLVAKGADIKSTSVITGISAEQNTIREFSGLRIDTIVVNVEYDEFHKELQDIEQAYDSWKEGRTFRRARVSADSRSRTDNVSLSYCVSNH